MTKELTLNKFAAGLVGLAMVAGLASAVAVQRAHAADLTLSDLVEFLILSGVITDEKADEAREAVKTLGGTSGSTPAAPAATSCNFTRDLKTGASGADVKELQKLLNGKGYTVAATGAGSVGMETEYYGPATAAAVAKMQEAFAADILAPLGLTKGTGFFGAATRKVVNEKVCATVVPPVLPPEEEEDDDEGTEEEEEESSELSGEASLKTLEIDSASDDEIGEGSEDAEIGEVTVEFSDGDAMITRLDVRLVADSGNTEKDPWDVFETLSLWVDGDMVAEKDVDSKSDYLDDGDGTLRFSGLDIVAMEDEEMVITIAATVMGSVDGAGSAATWNLSADALRFVDGDDVTSTEASYGALGNPGDQVSFEITSEGGDDELIVKTSSSDPDSSIIKVESDSKSDWVTVFVFDLDTDDSENDITLNSIPVTVTTPGTSTFNGLIDDARLVIDGTTIDSTSADVTDGGTATAVVTFDVDGDVVIDAGDRVKAELQLRFKALAAGDEGATVKGEVTSANANNIDAEGADDLANSPVDQLDGSAAGEEHQILTKGVSAEIVSTDADTTVKDGVDDTGTFVIKFDVTAFEKDYFINNLGTRATGSVAVIPATGAIYRIVDSNGAAYDVTSATSTVNAVLSSTADEESNEFKVNDGETETFTLTVTFTPGDLDVNKSYRLELLGLIYSEAAGGAAMFHTASPDTDFRTDYVNIGA